MGLEASDLSDGTILEATQQFQNGNGQVQFKIKLPSGRELESEWLSPDMKKKAMVAWLDAVKAEAMSDADAARAEAREVAMKQRREALDRTSSDAAQAQAQTQGLGSTEDYRKTGPSLSAPAQAADSVPAAGVRLPTTSPDSFVEAGLSAARANYDHWNNVALDAAQRLTVALQNIDKWTNIKIALEGNASQNSGNNSGAGSGSPSTGPKRLSRKKRVAKSTDFAFPDLAADEIRR